MYLTCADLLKDLCPFSSWTSILLLPKIAVTQKFGWYLGSKIAASGSLTNTMSFTLKLWGSSSFFGYFSLALRMVCTTTIYNLLSVSIFKALPLSPQYLGLGSKSFATGIIGSLPNIKMNGDSLLL